MTRTYESAVAHLSNDQLDQLISDYYAGKPIKDLLREYSVQCRPNFLHRAFPPVVLDDLKCPYCDVSMLEERPSRTSIDMGNFRAEIYCSQCGHREDEGCRCSNCIAAIELEKRLIEDARQDMVRAFCLRNQSHRRGHVAADELSLREAVGLLTLTRACTFMDELDSHGNAVLDTLINSTIPLAPGRDLGIALITQLKDAGLVSISDSSSPAAFKFQNDVLTAYIPAWVNWALTVDEPFHLLTQVEQLAAQQDRWPESWHRETGQLWREIALEECKEYFEHAATERGLPPAGALSTETMLRNLLNDYSVAQCYRIIYAGAQQTADFLVRKRCTKTHAANYMIGACQRWADRARTEGWEVSLYRRRFDLPRSALSHVLFDVFLAIGEEGFNTVPKSPASLKPVTN